MIYNNRLKQYSLLVGLIVIISISISCKKNKESNDTVKDSITILYIGDERIFHQDYFGMEATYWIFLPLVAHAGEYNGEIKPVLAESWTHTDDYKTWTVKLRNDIFWHDGVQMTAHDIKFSFDLRNKLYGGLTRNLKCEIIDDFKFNLILENPISNLPYWEVYYPKHLLEELDLETYYDWDFWTHPIGNGPYKFVRNVPKTMVEVEVNPNYFGREPKIKKAILKFSNKPSLQELLSGNVDAITFVPRDFLFKIKGDDRFKSYYWLGTGVKSLFWNHNNPLFKEAKVRKALTMAIDRVELLKVLNYPDDIPITDVLFTQKQLVNFDFPTPLTYNQVKAIELLKECGWTDTNTNGVLDRNGIDFRFILTVNESNKLMAIYIQNSFKEIGVIMDIETMENSIMWQRFKKGDFEALIKRFLNNLNVFELRSYFGENSYFGYKNEKLDSILNLIEDTGDINEIDRLYKELIPIFERDIPITFICPVIQTHIVNSKVRGLENLFRSDPAKALEFLWIE